MHEIFIDTPDSMNAQIDSLGRLRLSAAGTTFVIGPGILYYCLRAMVEDNLFAIGSKRYRYNTTPQSY